MHYIRSSSFVLGIALGLAATRANATMIVTVGPDGNFSTLHAAVAAADANTKQSYVIEVDPGTYTNDFSVVTRAMTIEVNPNDKGPVVLLATEPPSNYKGIITTSASLTVDGLTFEGAEISPAKGSNGAGIRAQAGTTTLTVENSIFKDDQDGILANPNPGENITISGSEFISDGFDAGDDTCPKGGCDHAIYANAMNSLTVTDSVFCGTLVGHDIKSRAAKTTITKNQIYDGAPDKAIGCPAGSTSYGIDLPNGGVGVISDNQIIQGAATQNRIMVSYGEEGLTYTDNSLLLSDNDLTSTGVPGAIGVNDPKCIPVQLKNNVFKGITTDVNPPKCADFEGVNAGNAAGTTPVPEPGSLLVLLSALAGCFVIRARPAARA